MNWAPPSPTLPPPHADAAGTPAAEPTSEHEPESRALRRALSAVPAAVWVAMLGSGLLLTAAVAVVASNWNAIGQSFRVAGLAVVTTGLLLVAERLRSVVPATASVIGHVATYLVASVPIAVLSLFGVTWPLCLTAGGLALVCATEVQATRWRRVTMHGAQLAGWAMAATGLAALLHTTAGVIAAIAAAGLLVAGAHRRSAALALLAVFSPILTALAAAGIGAGTFERAGIIGERLSWSGPTVGLIAATIVGAVAYRRRNNPLLMLAAASPVVGAVTGLAAVDGSAVAWWCVPGLALITTEIAVWMLPADRFRRHIIKFASAVGVAIAAAGWLTPSVASALTSSDFTNGPTAWAVPIVVTAVGLALVTLRWKGADSRLADVGVAATLATLLAVAVALQVPEFVVAGLGVVMTVAAVALSRTLSPVAVYGTAVWALLAIGALSPDGSTGSVTSVALLAALAGAVLFARCRLAAANGPVGWAELTLAGFPFVAAAAAVLPGSNTAVALGAAAAFAVAVALIDDRMRWWAISWVAAAGLISADAATAFHTFDRSYVIGWLVATGGFAVLWAVRRTTLMAAATAASSVITVALLAPTFDVPLADFLVMALLSTAALTGLAWAFRGQIALDVAAATGGVALLGGSMLADDTAWVSLAWLVLSTQVLLAGTVSRHMLVRLVGACGVIGALGSFWFTLGAHDWFIAVIDPLDVRVADVWMAALVVAATIVGITLRATIDVNSWAAYSAPQAIALIWLVSTHLERSPGWTAPTLLTLGVFAAVAGAWRRLGAPLVGGTVLTLVGTFFSIGSDLTSVPTWLWLSLAGTVLLGVAVLIERAGRPGTTDIRALIARWE